MAENFTVVWRAIFGWLVDLLRMPLPFFFGGTALNMLDIIIGTIGILVAFASIRALIKSGFSIAGKDLINTVNTSRNADPKEKIELTRSNMINNRIKANGGSVDVSDLKKDGLL